VALVTTPAIVRTGVQEKPGADVGTMIGLGLRRRF